MKNVILLFLFLLISGCNERENSKPLMDIEVELAAIENTRAIFEKAVKEGDIESIKGLVTKDVKTIGPGSSDWANMYSTGTNIGPFPYDSIIMSPEETVIVSDTVAYDFGTSRVFYTDSVGQVMELKDSFLAILKKGNDGVWRLHREVASSKVLE